MLSAGVLAGVIIGIVLSIGWLAYVSATPAMSELGREPGTSAFRSVEEYPDSEHARGLLVVRFDGGLTCVTSESLADGVENRLQDAVEPFTAVVIDFAGVNFIDSQGADHIGQLVELAKRDGWTLRLARVRGDVLSVLDADGVLARLGLDRVHNNVDQAVQAELDARDAAGDR